MADGAGTHPAVTHIDAAWIWGFRLTPDGEPVTDAALTPCAARLWPSLAQPGENDIDPALIWGFRV